MRLNGQSCDSGCGPKGQGGPSEERLWSPVPVRLYIPYPHPGDNIPAGKKRLTGERKTNLVESSQSHVSRFPPMETNGFSSGSKRSCL